MMCKKCVCVILTNNLMNGCISKISAKKEAFVYSAYRKIICIFGWCVYILKMVIHCWIVKLRNHIYIFFIVLSCIVYILINKEFFIWSLNGTRLSHKQLTLGFFLGLNFKHFFTSYILGFINLIIIYLSIWKLKKNIFWFI